MRTSTVPLIDSISGENYDFSPQAGGDANNLARGAWNWRLDWKRIPLQGKHRGNYQHESEPYPMTAMAGGLFAIHKQYFSDLNFYDDGLLIWGAENFEISWKIWMCHGQVLNVPCSRVGHIYRMGGWHGNAPNSNLRAYNLEKNYMRIVDVWWGSYKKYFYRTRPSIENLDYGSIAENLQWKEDNQCKSFEWYMENIASDVLEKYPLPSPVKKFGVIIPIDDIAYCWDSAGDINRQVSTYMCSKNSRQIFILTESGELVNYINHGDEFGHCVVPGEVNPNKKLTFYGNYRPQSHYSYTYKIGSKLLFQQCQDHDYFGIWQFDESTSQIRLDKQHPSRSHNSKILPENSRIEYCIEMTGKTKSLVLAECDVKNSRQKFRIEPVYYEDRKRG